MPDGSAKVETNGFTGSECRDASQFLEKALGKTYSEKLKPEFHQTSTTQSQQASE
ncbi:MAG: DUF2997 domain-containing protein [Planctomycetales bacterium]|nr:DUF2997 domain-containing protein [Planctomycetales bacterium]